jgi:hypothetical protein
VERYLQKTEREEELGCEESDAAEEVEGDSMRGGR